METVSLQFVEPKFNSNIKVVTNGTLAYFDLITPNEQDTLINYFNIDMQYNLADNLAKYVQTIKNKDIIFEQKIVNNNLDVYEQYEDAFSYGVRNTNIYNEKYTFLAPFKIGEKIPDFFVICKYNKLDNSNLIEIQNNSTVLKVIDLRESSILGKFLNNHLQFITKNKQKPIFVNFDNKKITYNGIDILNGTIKNVTDEWLNNANANERTITEFDNYVTDGFARNLILPLEYLNLEFLFEDNEIGICKYYGFYANVKNTFTDVSTFDFTSKKILLKDTFEHIKTLPQNVSEIRTIYDTKYFIKQPTLTGCKARIDFKYTPAQNSKIILKLEQETVLNIRITRDIIKNTPQKTVAEIVRRINEYAYFNGQSVYFTAQHFYNTTENYIVLSTDVNSTLLESIIFEEIPAVCTKTDFKYIETINKYISVDSFNENVQDIVSYFNNTNIYNIVRSFVDVYDINNTIFELNSEIESIHKFNGFVKNSFVDFYEIMHIDHYEYDKIYTLSEYDYISDFDLNSYNTFIQNTVNSSAFKGKYENASEVPQTYKDNILTILKERYFTPANIESLNKKLFLSDLNTLKTTNNVYDRLSEYNTVKQTKNTNNSTLKFVYAYGNNALGAPYRLNNSITFRQDNVTPNIYKNDRILDFFTHHYFVIATNVPKYFMPSEIEQDYTILNNLKRKKYTSFANKVITKQDIENINYDIKQDLVHFEGTANEIVSYAKIQYDNNTNNCYSLFRGLLYKFDEKYKDYSFIVILIPSQIVEKTINIDVFDNYIHKNLIVYIEMFIPEPMLTTLEGEMEYSLDRSLLYVSNNAFTTEPTSVITGQSEISLRIRNKEPFWLQSVETDKYLFYIYNTDINDDLTNKVRKNTDFIVFIGNVTTSIIDDYGYKVTFKNIIAVTKEYFVCEDIFVQLEYNNTYISENTLLKNVDINDNIVGITPLMQFNAKRTLNTLKTELNTTNINVLENELFAYFNVFNVLEPLLLYNAQYNDVIGDTIFLKEADFNNRYKNINIFNFINYFQQPTTKKYFSIVQKTPFEIVSILESKVEKNSNILVKNNYKKYTLERYNGQYEPQIIPIYIHNKGNNTRNNVYTTYNNIQLTTVNSATFYTQQEYDFSKLPIYYTVDNSNNIVSNEYVAYINDYASYVSTIVNVPFTFIVTLTKNSTISLSLVFEELINVIIKNTQTSFQLTQQSIFYIINKKYTIQSIIGKTTNVKYTFTIENNVIILQNNTTQNEQLNVTLILN